MYNKAEHFVVEKTENRNGRIVKIGSFYCITNGKTYPTLGGLRNGIRPTKLSVEEYYIEYYKTPDEGKCIVCDSKTAFDNVVDGYKKYCSISCSNKSLDHRCRVSTRFERSPETLDSYLIKRKTWYSNLSVEDKKVISDKRVKTTLSNNPNHFFELGRKASVACQELYKNDPSRREAAIKKTLETKRKNDSFVNGMSGKVKQFEYNDTIYEFQGYEDIVLLYLLENNINFRSRNAVPVVKIDSISGKYVPDVYLPDYNLLIDVKSERTISMNVEKLILKQNAALEQGYNFIYFAISSKYVRKARRISELDQIQFRKFLDMLISSQACKGRFNDYPLNRSTLQAIGSGNAEIPEMECDIV